MTTSVEQRSQGWIADDASFGARLALVRQRMGWTNVKEAAVACGLPAENWRRWERGGAEPRRLVTIAMTIATRTGCDFLWLVHGPSRGGATSQSYLTSRVVARVRPPIETPVERGSHLRNPARSVRQTRPLVGVAIRPLTPVAV